MLLLPLLLLSAAALFAAAAADIIAAGAASSDHFLSPGHDFISSWRSPSLRPLVRPSPAFFSAHS